VTRVRPRHFVFAALALAASGAGAVLALTSFAPGSWIATWAPCPRNWGWAPAWQPRKSPLRSVSLYLLGADVKICYGSPSLRGRTMIGGEAVPYGKLWRTGANEPTTVHADKEFQLEGLQLGAGSYSLYSVPGPESWQFVVNRSIRQWGLESEYTAEVAAQEVGRFEVPVETLARPVESLTFRVEEEPEGLSGVADVYLEWQTSRVRIRFVG
jgi:hypothetical protein